MAERVTTSYERLFEVRILHHYWLDEGGTIFDLIPAQSDREHRLLTYDATRFLDVQPTTPTTSTLQGLGCLFKPTPLGCLVVARATTVIPPDTTLEFGLTVRDPAFFNYTALTLRPKPITAVYYEPQKRLYRYKENVPVLSNLTGASRMTAAGKQLFLSAEIPAAIAADDQVEAFARAGGALVQLTGDQPGGPTQQLGAQAADLPVFVHQGDVPSIVPPPGLQGAPARGVELSEGLADDLFCLIRLSAVRAGDADFSFIDNTGHARTPYPVYQVRFKNRSAFWRYLDKGTGAVSFTEPSALPFTRFGNAGTRQKPSAGLVRAEWNGNAISRLVADIYV